MYRVCRSPCKWIAIKLPVSKWKTIAPRPSLETIYGVPDIFIAYLCYSTVINGYPVLGSIHLSTHRKSDVILYYTTLHYSTYSTLHHTTRQSDVILHRTTSHHTIHHTRYTHYTTLHHTTLHYTTPHYTTVHYTTLHYTTLHTATALHHTQWLRDNTHVVCTLHYTTLHYTLPLHCTTLNG